MPAYHCGSEVEAVRLTGAEVAFYRVDATLQVDRSDLERVARSSDVTYLISYFGFPLAEPPAGNRVIADVAHGLFSGDPGGPLGSVGLRQGGSAASVPAGPAVAAAIFCPRKSLGVPDGGAVLVAGEALLPAPGCPGRRATLRSTASLLGAGTALSSWPVLRGVAGAMMTKASRGDAALAAGTLTETVIGGWDLRVDDMEAAASAPSRLSRWLIDRSEAAGVRDRRRANYEFLSGKLGDACPQMFRLLPPGTCPLYLPVMAEDRQAALVELRAKGIRAIEVWPVPHPLLDRSRFSELEPLRNGLLGLPVHQDLRPWHMKVVAEAARSAGLDRDVPVV